MTFLYRHCRNNRCQLTLLIRTIWHNSNIYLGLNLVASTALLGLVSCVSNNNNPTFPDSVPPMPPSSNLITLHYNERPPYLVTANKGVAGLTGDPGTIAFEKSGIPFQWKQTPSQRQLYLLQQNSGRDCLVGWLKIPEREGYAKYTLPIYQDEPQIALARADNANIPTGTIGNIFSNPQLTLLVKAGYSYGDFIDKKIDEYNPIRMETTVENSAMLQIVYAKHADFFLIAPEEAAGLIKSSEFDLHDFKFIHFTDIPYGEQRYILCSMQVEDETIEQLNATIRQHIVISPPQD